MTKHYVIALGAAYLPKIIGIEKGSIISRHESSGHATQAAEKCNAKNGASSRRNPLFGALETELTLSKGEVRADLADRWIQQKFDADAIFVMKCVIDPTWRDGKAFDDETISIWLAELKLTLEELRIRYQDVAQDELNKAHVDRIAYAERKARQNAVQKGLSEERSQYTFSFPAVAGTQAGKAFYVAQVPLNALVRLFRFDEDDVVPAHMRAQRVLNEGRAAKIGEYMTANPDEYVLPAITASVSAEMAFEAFPVPGAAGSIGLLHIPMEATLLINDGQHRRGGIERAIKQMPALAKETIAVTLYFDQGLERSQQMFADINGRQVKPSSAINALYDRRNPYNKWVLDVIQSVPGIGSRIDMENSSVAAKSYKLWSLIAFKKALSLLTGVTEKSIVTLDDAQLGAVSAFVAQFFAACADRIPDWQSMVSGRIAASDVREQFVIGHAVFLEALAVFGRHALFAGGADGQEGVIRPEAAQWAQLDALAKVDTRRSALVWQNRCVVLGKMQKTADGVNGTAAALLALAEVPLPQEMQALELRLAA